MLAARSIRLVASAVGAILLACPFVAGCGSTDPAPAPRKTSSALPSRPAGDGPTGSSTERAKAKGPYSMTVDAYIAEHRQNPEAAFRKYKGSTVELTGKVSAIGYGRDYLPTVTLQATMPAGAVFCMTAEKEPWAKVAPGQRVKIRGKAVDLGMTCGLVEAVFVDVPPSAAIRISATELTKEFEDNKQQADEKYKDRCLIVAGEILEAQKQGEQLLVRLKGHGKMSVRCLLLIAYIERTQSLESLKPGAKLRIFGHYYDNNDEEVNLTAPLIVTGAN